MVQHRMPDGEVTQGDVTFADEADTHPLGRKIDLGDPSLQSAYRIKDDVIMEVNRIGRSDDAVHDQRARDRAQRRRTSTCRVRSR